MTNGSVNKNRHIRAVTARVPHSFSVADRATPIVKDS
jgi:hypothetical protein